MRLRAQKVFDKPNDGAAAPPVPTETPASPEPAAPPAAVAGNPPAPPAAAAPPAPAAGADGQPPKPAKPDWREERIGKLTHDLNEARRQIAAAAAAPAPVQNAGESEAAFQQRVEEAAQAKAIAMAAEQDWNRQCNAVADAGKAEFADFNARLGAIQASINSQDANEVAQYNEIIAAAIETGQAHKILYNLGGDPGEYQRLVKLSPVKRAMELGVMASKLVSSPEPSGAPRPITPVGSTGTHYEGIRPDDPKTGMKLPKAEWFKQREEQARAKGIQ